jgi:Zn-dependent protease with chaperone function
MSQVGGAKLALACPQCHESTVGGGSWTTWCRACGWNVDPQPPQPAGSRVTRWWQHKVEAAVRREHVELLKTAGAIPENRNLRRLTTALAVVIQLGTVCLVALAVGIWFTPLSMMVQLVISLIAGLVAIAVLPISHWRRTAPSANGWGRADAPNLFALLDAVALSVGSPPPDRVVVGSACNAAIGRVRQQTVLTIGLPLWELLDDAARVCLLAHELGHLVNGDIRNQRLIHASTVTSDKWLSLLWPAPSRHQEFTHRRKPRLLRHHDGSAIGDAVLQLLLVPVYGLALAFSRAYLVCVTRSGQRAEYGADRLALAAGGSDAMCQLFGATLCADLVMFKLDAAVRRGDRELTSSLPTLLNSVPDHERERLRRRAEIRMQQIDATHPPTTMRADYIAAAPYVGEPAVDLDRVPPASEELRRTRSAVDRALQSRFGA